MCLNKEIALEDIIDLVIEKVESGSKVTFTPNGTSMLPMLRDGEDVVVLEKAKGKLHLFDLPLYRRDSGQFVLHRVIDFDRNGTYVMCGDNQFSKEHGIRDNQIIAVVTAFYRKGKPYHTDCFRYRLYLNFWYYSRPFRYVYSLGKRGVKKVFGLKNKEQEKENTDKETA